MKLLSKKNKSSGKQRALKDELFEMEDDAGYNFTSDDESSLSDSDDDDYGYGYANPAEESPMTTVSAKSAPRRGSIGKMVTRSADGLQAMKNSLIGGRQNPKDEKFSDDDSFEMKLTDEKKKLRRSNRRSKSDDQQIARMRNATKPSFEHGNDAAYQRPPCRRSSTGSNGSYHSAATPVSRRASIGADSTDKSVGSHHSFMSGSMRSNDSRRPRSGRSTSRSSSRSPVRGSKSPTPRSRSGSVSGRSKRRSSLQMLSSLYHGDEVHQEKPIRRLSGTGSKSSESLKAMQRSIKAEQEDESSKGGLLSRGLHALEKVYDSMSDPNTK